MTLVCQFRFIRKITPHLVLLLVKITQLPGLLQPALLHSILVLLQPQPPRLLSPLALLPARARALAVFLAPFTQVRQSSLPSKAARFHSLLLLQRHFLCGRQCF